MANDKTEKATPKKKEDARKKGQVAKSADVNGAAVLLAGLFAMSMLGPKVMEQMRLAMLQVIALVARPDVVEREGIGELFVMVGKHVGLAALPIAAVCFVAGLAAAAGQVGLKPTPGGDQARLQEDQPGLGPQEPLQPAAPGRRDGQEPRQGRDRGRDRRAGAVPQARRAGRAGGHSAGRSDPPGRGHRDDDRAALGGRLSGDRGRRLRLAALPAREAAPDGPPGDQAGVQAAWAFLPKSNLHSDAGRWNSPARA